MYSIILLMAHKNGQSFLSSIDQRAYSLRLLYKFHSQDKKKILKPYQLNH